MPPRRPRRRAALPPCLASSRPHRPIPASRPSPPNMATLSLAPLTLSPTLPPSSCGAVDAGARGVRAGPAARDDVDPASDHQPRRRTLALVPLTHEPLPRAHRHVQHRRPDPPLPRGAAVALGSARGPGRRRAFALPARTRPHRLRRRPARLVSSDPAARRCGALSQWARSMGAPPPRLCFFALAAGGTCVWHVPRR